MVDTSVVVAKNGSIRQRHTCFDCARRMHATRAEALFRVPLVEEAMKSIALPSHVRVLLVMGDHNGLVCARKLTLLRGVTTMARLGVTCAVHLPKRTAVCGGGVLPPIHPFAGNAAVNVLSVAAWHMLEITRMVVAERALGKRPIARPPILCRDMH